MKKLKIFLGLIVMGFLALTIVSSCNKDELFQNAKNDVGLNTRDATTVIGNQDAFFAGLARVVSVGVAISSDFRQLIQVKANEQFDGDYDVLITQIKDKLINTPQGKKYVKDFLNSIYSSLINEYVNSQGEELGVLNIANQVGTNLDGTHPNDIIENIITAFPAIQVSVPVHAEDWNANTYVPVVTYLPEDYNEGVTTTFVGFQNNVKVNVDAVTPPDQPVLVIGLCERLGSQNIITEPPNVSIILNTSPSTTGIALSWTVSNPNNDEISGYKIYRKTVLQNNFELIYDNIGKENTIFNDNSVKALLNYYYYVKAYNAIGESVASNISTTTAPNVPNQAESFSANHYAMNEIELRWAHASGQNVNYTSLFKRIVGTNPDYLLLGNFPTGVNEYLDFDNSLAGKKVLYKAVANNYQGSSNPKYDFVQVPFRNVANPSPTKIWIVEYDLSSVHEIEGWGRGKPEIQVSVVKAGVTGEAGVVQKEVMFNMDYRSQMFNRLILNWLPGNWMEVLTFEAVEVDGGPKIGLKVSAGFQEKNIPALELTKGTVDIDIPDITNTKNETIGRAEHRYLDPTNSILEFPQGGVKLHLSN